MNPKRFRFFLPLFLLPALLCAAPVTYTASLDGPSESPPNASPGIGFATVIYDPVAHTLNVSASFSGLLGNTTAAHIHAPTALPLTGIAGVATQTPSFIGFPLGVTSGVFNNTFDLTLPSSFNAAFITNNGGTVASAEAALASYLGQNRAYFNIHSTSFGGGEIRGFLVGVPDESSTVALLIVGLIPLCALRRLRARRA